MESTAMGKELNRKSPEDKAADIINKIARFIPTEIIQRVILTDARLQNLDKDFKKAQENQQFLKVAIIRNQQEARIREITMQMATKRMHEYVASGDIIEFMEYEDKARFNSIRGRIFLLYECLDMALTDMEGCIRGCGLYGHVTMMPQIRTAIDSIRKWGEETTKVHRIEVKDMIFEEADSIGEYIEKRLQVLQRKIDRKMDKIEKTKEK